MTAATAATMAQASGGQGKGHHQVSSAGAGGEYRAEGADKEESADEIAGWSGADLEGSATEEEATEKEATTAEEAGWGG